MHAEGPNTPNIKARHWVHTWASYNYPVIQLQALNEWFSYVSVCAACPWKYSHLRTPYRELHQHCIRPNENTAYISSTIQWKVLIQDGFRHNEELCRSMPQYLIMEAEVRP
jgi:hypothetical protein